MPHFIPIDWFSEPPRLLVVGGGPYANTLAQVLGAAQLAVECLAGGPERNEGGGFSRVLDHLETVFLVIPDDIDPAEALWHHHWVWDWIEKLTVGKEFHEATVIFIVGAEVPASLDHALATSLAVNKVAPAFCGHAIWQGSSPLADLLELARHSTRKDLQSLRGRRSADRGRKSLMALATVTNSCTTDEDLSLAASRLLDEFRGREFDLDLFCLPPCHRNGNVLRAWLHSAVTETVTPDIKKRGKDIFSFILV